MSVQTYRLCGEEMSKGLAVSVSDVVDVVLEYSRRMVEECPVLTDVWVDGFRDGVFARQEGAEGLVEIEIGELVRVTLSGNITALAGYFLTTFWVMIVTFKTVFPARSKAVGWPIYLALQLISSITC